MNMIADLATTSLVYFVLIIVAVAYRFAGELTEGKLWFPKFDHSYREWYEEPYEWTNMLARALTGFGIVFCVVGWLSVLLTYKSGQPLQYHFGLVFKWALLAGVLDVVYCIAYNIWLKRNRLGVIGIAYDWDDPSRIPISSAKAERAFRRQKRRLSRAKRKAKMLLKRRHGTGANKNVGNPKYRHLY